MTEIVKQGRWPEVAEVEIHSGRRFDQAQRMIVDAVKAADDGERFTVTLWGHARKHRNALLEWLALDDGCAAAINVEDLDSLPPGATGFTFSTVFGDSVSVVSSFEVVEDSGRWGKQVRAFEDGDLFAPAGVFLPDEDVAPSPVTDQRPMAWVF